MTTPMAGPDRFRDREIVFANGAAGTTIDIPSASPANYRQVIAAPGDMPKVTIDGKLFLPPAASRGPAARLPLVIVVPGSLGVAPSHVAHAETLTGAGFAAFVLDGFGARGVASTVANQTQFSFAASAYDVLAAWSVLAAHPAIDATRIGAQGHSRGGSAVLTAATRRFADAVVGSGRGLIAVLAATLARAAAPDLAQLRPLAHGLLHPVLPEDAMPRLKQRPHVLSREGPVDRVDEGARARCPADGAAEGARDVTVKGDLRLHVVQRERLDVSVRPDDLFLCAGFLGAVLSHEHSREGLRGPQRAVVLPVVVDGCHGF